MDERSLKLWVVLSRAYTAVEAHVKADIARQGFTPGEFGALEALHSKGPMLLGAVKQKILLSSGGITYVVDRLVEKGLVERRACPGDRRASYAALTAEGTSLMERVFPLHARVVERAVSGLSGEEQERAIDLLRALGHHAGELPHEPGEG